LLTLAMAPVLLLSYVRLARREERELEARFGEDYQGYRKQVPGCIPRWRPRRRREERSELVAFADRQRPEAES
jgi:hypothetical protein